MGVLSWTCRSQRKTEHRLARKATIKGGLRLGRFEVLRSLRHYLRARIQGHHTIDRLEQRGVERGIAQRSSLRRTEKGPIVNQTDMGTSFKGNSGKTPEETGWSAYEPSRAHRYHLELN